MLSMVFNSIKQIGGCLLQVIQKTELEYFSCFLTSMTLFRSVIGNQIGVNTNLRNGMVRGHNSFLGTSTKTHSLDATPRNPSLTSYSRFGCQPDEHGHDIPRCSVS